MRSFAQDIQGMEGMPSLQENDFEARLRRAAKAVRAALAAEQAESMAHRGKIVLRDADARRPRDTGLGGQIGSGNAPIGNALTFEIAPVPS
jgi:hypothetical protein